MIKSLWRLNPSLAIGLVLFAPAAILLLGLLVVPIIRIVWMALSEPSFGFENLYRLWTTPAPRRAVVTTLVMSGVVTMAVTLLSVLIAWELYMTTSRVKRLALWFAALFPLWTSVVVRNYAFTIILQHRGIVNTSLISIGIIDEPLGLLYTQFAVGLGMFYTMLPYGILPIYASFASLDRNLIDAAESLGASRLRAIAGIVLPLTLPGIFAAAAIVFVISIGFYITPLILGGPQSPFLATFVDLQINRLFDFPGAAGTATILFFSALAMIAIAWRAVGVDRLRRVLG